MVPELVIGLSCVALGFYAVHKLSDNCVLIVYRRDRGEGGIVTRDGPRRSHFSLGRTFRDGMQALREHGSLNVNFGSNFGGRNQSSHNWSISRGSRRGRAQNEGQITEAQ